MNSGHLGIFSLAFLSLLLTVPSAFADEHDSFSLTLEILDAQADLETLEALVEYNSFTVDWGDYTAETLEEALVLAASDNPDDWIQSQALLDNAELSHDYIYSQLYEQIEDQQEVRHEEYVINAKSSLTFLIENGSSLGLSQAVIDQLATTLAILESGTDGEIDAATGQIGITLSVLPSELSSLPPSFTTGSGFGEQLKSKLPPGIAKKYGYSTDSNLDTESIDGTGDEINDITNDDENGETDGFFESLFEFGAASENANPDAQGQGISLGEIPSIFDDNEFSPDDNAFAPPFLEFGDDAFEPRNYGQDRAAKAKLIGEQMRAEHDLGDKRPDVPGPPEEPPGPPNPPGPP